MVKCYFKNPSGKYVIRRKNKYYTTVNTEEEAKFLIRELEKVKWNVSSLNGEVNELYYKNKIKNKFYFERNGRYYIRKDGVYYGSVDSENTAKNIVRKLKKVGWDKNKLHQRTIDKLNFKPKYYYWLDDEEVYVVYINGEYYGRFLTEDKAKEMVASII